MKRQTVTGIVMLTVLLVSMLTLSFNIHPVMAGGTIYIRADGSVDPSTAPISSMDNVTYYFTDNIYDSLVVDRDNIVIDGKGYVLKADPNWPTIELVGRSNVTIKNAEIFTGQPCVYLVDSSNNIISGNIIHAGMPYSLLLLRGSNNTISENYVSADGNCITLCNSCNNTVSGNRVNGGYIGIAISGSCNIISGNNLTNNYVTSICLSGSSCMHNVICGNNIESMLAEKYCGILIQPYSNNIPSNNFIYHNNFVVSPFPGAYIELPSLVNIWDDGYPSGGNYWDDYPEGVDFYSGPNQDEPGSDGIWDHPYIIDENNQDNYPFVEPWSPVEPDFEISVSPSSQSVDIPQFVEYEITVSSLNGFSSQVTLDVSIAPLADYDIDLDDTYVTPPPNGETQTTLRFNTYPNTPPQTYEIMVAGVSEGIEKSVSASLNVYAVKGIETLVTINEFTVEPSKKTNLLFTIQQNFVIPIAFDGDQTTRYYIVQNAIAVTGKPSKYKMEGIVNIWEYKWSKPAGDLVASHSSKGDYKNEVIMQSIIQDSTLKLENDFLNFTHTVPAGSFIDTRIAEIVIVAPGQKNEEKIMNVKFVEPTSGHIAAHFLLGSNDWVNGKMWHVHKGETLTRETSEGLTCYYIGVGIFEAIVPSYDDQGFRISPDHDSPL